MLPFERIFVFLLILSLSDALPTSSRMLPTRTALLPTTSPAYLPSFPASRNTTSQPTGPLLRKSLNLGHYPPLWAAPNTQHPEVQRAIRSIDWTHVPSFLPRPPQGDASYDDGHDPACWWSRTECTRPKQAYLPEDIAYCENPHDFGLTYDDGPLNPRDANDTWGEPQLYDFLATYNQQATLFYVGSNVVSFPQAAQRAIQAGHTLCVHTWSHPQMTTISNEMIVAELYWTLRAIKEATGVTSRCWRPPFGDVDDRVRAIAHQMGLRTILWNSDSFDWKLPSVANDYQGTFDDLTVDRFFQAWIDRLPPRHGRLVLEHETSDKTIQMSEKWLPRLKNAFEVKKVHDCVPLLSSPYWES
ncbi:hypothetical protein G6F46_011353 [Rhizopus delemar]|uniref:NodB homology domain-containing protein n=2 Tax=Rhizopus TaxID=4842 RepID=A0A9P6YX39_9FUNG|nr:hypothetical protein G6F55_008018 [Rhizopus delemar]KAG1539063.1 hypothetical protein G6F51_009371 [Rhizopus arrhizus]KAG1489686.1 hypothetical protein G6F54_011260 [Rhizopus delemar]KAG1513332.1 hypothetical protein G6F53_004506 [Rhizopus delemar]KAG1515753.1 hypothetical protein G6F52_009603 [Rhizopus delemar]